LEKSEIFQVSFVLRKLSVKLPQLSIAKPLATSRKMTSKKHIKLGKRTALISLIIGTLIFGFYFLTSNDELLFIGYGFIIIAGIFNLIVLIAILSKSNSDSEIGKDFSKLVD